MKTFSLLLMMIVTGAGSALVAQPSHTAPPPSRQPVEDPALRRAAYLQRRDEVLR